MVQFTHWKFKKASDSAWKSSHTDGPTTEIFPDLIYQGDIPHPFVDRNEALVQWVGNAEWFYRSVINVDQAKDHAQLVFHGLDTVTSVYFNGEHILDTNNMFTSYTKDVQLKIGENELVITFYPVTHVPDKPYDPITLLPEFGNDRLFIRKAQYHYGWDWGPTLMTCGIYKPVELVAWNDASGKLGAIDVNYDLELKENKVTFKVTAEVNNGIESSVSHVLKFEDEIIWEGSGLSASETLEDVNLWFPFTHGTPHLYTLITELKHKGKVIDSKTQQIGFRKSELIQEPLSEGSSFYFKINEIDVYVNGCNWIPASPFLTTVTHDDYKNWLSLMHKANQNMIRIWGGGIYEYDCFYEICDKIGLLVWQDFMFACGQYPGDDRFVQSVAIEAKQNVQRLKPHPSVVIYAGNNEDYQTRDEFHIPDDEFYARKIYEKTLPDTIEKVYGPGKVMYVPGSPYSPDDVLASDLTMGDVHQWNVWHGKELPYQQWASLVGRFVSEFGMQAMPHFSTLDEYITNKSELFPQSAVVEYHNKAQGFEKKLALYMYNNIRLPDNDLRSWIYGSQVMQADAMMFAVHAMRRQWKSSGDRRCGGQLVWQINDTYPVTSWALVDSKLRPKLAYYSIRRHSGECVIGSTRSTDDIEVYVMNSGNARELKIKARVFDTNSRLLDSWTESVSVSIEDNATTECFKKKVDPKTIVSLQLKDGDKIVSEFNDWPQPLKYYTISGSEIDSFTVEDGSMILHSPILVKGVFIECPDGTELADNGFDLIPGESKIITAVGLTKSTCVRVFGTKIRSSIALS
jgi:beta-mannosidase